MRLLADTFVAIRKVVGVAILFADLIASQALQAGGHHRLLLASAVSAVSAVSAGAPKDELVARDDTTRSHAQAEPVRHRPIRPEVA